MRHAVADAVGSARGRVPLLILVARTRPPWILPAPLRCLFLQDRDVPITQTLDHRALWLGAVGSAGEALRDAIRANDAVGDHGIYFSVRLYSSVVAVRP